MQQEHLSDKERQMVQLYIAACFHKWDQLPGVWGCLSRMAYR